MAVIARPSEALAPATFHSSAAFTGKHPLQNKEKLPLSNGDR